MTHRIFKYTLHYYNEPESIEMPQGAHVIDFELQDSAFHIWAVINPEEKKTEKRVFLLIFTGKDITHKIVATYGTRILPNGLVLHLLELAKATKATDYLTDTRIRGEGVN